MGGVAELAMGIAPIAGGMALGAAAGYLKGPDIRKAIKQIWNCWTSYHRSRRSVEPNSNALSTLESTT